MATKYLPFTNPKDDGRVKILPELHDEIRVLHSEGITQTELALHYNVSRSTISIIVNPARAEAVKARVKEHWRDYIDKDEHNKAMRNLRRKKVEMGLSITVKEK